MSRGRHQTSSLSSDGWVPKGRFPKVTQERNSTWRSSRSSRLRCRTSKCAGLLGWGVRLRLEEARSSMARKSEAMWRK